jgi:hypothetical protein
MEAIGLVVLIFYTIFSGCQAYYGRQQAAASITAANDATQSLKTINSQFQLDQRPYVFISKLDMDNTKTHMLGPPVIGQPVAATVYFKNVGKSPAFNLIIHRHILVGQGNMIKLKIELPDQGKGGAVLAPGIEKTTTVVSLKDTYSNESFRVMSNEVVNWDGSFPIMVFGRISYKDTFGNAYCTPIGAVYLPNHIWLDVNDITNDSTIHNVSDFCPPGTMQ